jgi:REP element-mobilizing transposase RayT
MPFIKIYIHLVWATKNRAPVLTKDIRRKVFKHIKEYGESKSIHIDSVNGYLEHVHLLVSLNSDQNISTIMNLIKGESSHWINKNNLTTSYFGWQDEYFAVSVSYSHIERVRNYIFGQEKHHSLKTWGEEYDELITKYGFEKG